MNRGELRDFLETRIGDSTSRWSDDQKNIELNIAAQRVADYPFYALKKIWPFLEATTTVSLVPSQQFVTKPSAIKHILGIWIGSSFAEAHNANKIAYCPPKELEERFYAAGSFGRPSVYTLFGDKIYFNSLPTEASTIFIKYGRTVPEMSSDSSQPLDGLMPSEYHYLIAVGAVEQLKLSNGGSDISESNKLKTEFNGGLQVMAEALLTPELDRTGFVRDVDEFDADIVGLLN